MCFCVCCTVLRNKVYINFATELQNIPNMTIKIPNGWYLYIKITKLISETDDACAYIVTTK